MSLSLILMGFLIGMRHAMEADHVAAVATLATRSSTLRQSALQGAAWGMGHTLTLFVVGSIALLADSVIPARLAAGLELAVGIMLIGLGADVLRQLYRKRMHFHAHQHENGKQHFHAHSHQGEAAHAASAHNHRHRNRFPYRALFIGLMHGMAGSAALILLTLQTVESLQQGLLYIALFGGGSIIGMALLSMMIALPLRRHSASQMTWLYHSLHGLVGVFTLSVGALIVFDFMRPVI